jgi:hypothetical protein
MRLIVVVLAAMAMLAAEAPPRIVYTKSFAGSTPAFVSITVERDGRVVYQEAADDPNPIKLQLAPADADAIFAVVEKLDRFKRPLESGLKVANMGQKTLRFEHGTQVHETKFNYTQDPDGALLADWFERVIETEQLFINLERTVRFDKLGVNQALLRLEAWWDRKRIVAEKQFLPLLDRVRKNESYLHMARQRAAALADAFRGEAPKATQ